MGSDEEMMGSSEAEFAGTGVSISGDGTVALVGSHGFSKPPIYTGINRKSIVDHQEEEKTKLIF
jgi:hypothetical protein